MDEYDDFDWEGFDRAMEADLLEFEALEGKINEGLEWLDVLFDLRGKLNLFNSNMDSIHQGMLLLSEKNMSNDSFLNGIFLAGIVSAYEGFVHDFFDICCGKPRYIKLAVSNIKKLSDKDRSYLRLKPGSSERHLQCQLKKATRHDPVQIARISLIFFDLKMPVLNPDHTKVLLEQRNLFTHHGGFYDGKSVNIKPEYVSAVYSVIYRLVNGYINEINGHASKSLD